MPEYKCLKGQWDTAVKATSEAGARVALKCDDCSLFPRQCAGYGHTKSKEFDAEAKIRAALVKLIQTPPHTAPRSKARSIVETHYADIKAALGAGHTIPRIAKTLKEAGASISQWTLYKHLKRMEAEAEGPR